VDIKVGDILIPQSAYCDDGTSPHYIRENPAVSNELMSISNPLSKFQNLLTGNRTIFISQPDTVLMETLLKSGISLLPQKMKKVNLWTTDALFCESLEFIRSLQSVGIQGIDMESSILFLLGKLFNIKTASILSVTDLPGSMSFDLLHSKEVHPHMETGIDNAIRILINSLPEIQKLNLN
jgi:purine-nucleoside phosphorylase